MIGATGNMDLLVRMLDAAALRQNVIANNVANVNTPGYRAFDVAFEDALRATLEANPEGRAGNVQPQVVEAQGGAERADGNNVDIDLEMARLQKNAIFFKIYSQLIATQLAQHRSAISGR